MFELVFNCYTCVILFFTNSTFQTVAWFGLLISELHCFKYQPIYRYIGRDTGTLFKMIRQLQTFIEYRFEPIWADISPRGDISPHIGPKQYPVKFCTYCIILDKIPVSRPIYRYIEISADIPRLKPVIFNEVKLIDQSDKMEFLYLALPQSYLQKS